MSKSFKKSLNLLIITACIMCLVLQGIGLPSFAEIGRDTAAVNDGVRVSYEDVSGQVESLAQSEMLNNMTEETAAPGPDDIVTVIVELSGKPMLDFAMEKDVSVSDALKTGEGAANLRSLDRIRENALSAADRIIVDAGYDYSTVFNGFSAKIRYRDLGRLENMTNVKRVMLSDTYAVPEAITENEVDVHETGIFNSEGVGYDGTGTVVAVLDTGTDYTHEVFDMELDPDSLAIDKDDVAEAAGSLAATNLSAANNENIDEDDLYISSKLPFAYDYADQDTNVYPVNSHGTHVAGIIAGKSDTITGVATKAQIATFKVFSDADEGATQEAILAALNDAVTLGVDAINMSLGTSCGFTREEDEAGVNEVYDKIEQAGICLVVAASNDYSSAQGGAHGDTNLAGNPDSGTVGSPASYPAALAVASISGVKTKYMVADGQKEIYFTESRKVGQEEENDFVAGILGNKSEGEFGYVVVPGVGLSGNYSGLDVKGKIAVVKRGSNSFEDKVKIAQEKGAVGVIIYNNVSGTINMSVGTGEYVPSCSVSMDMGNYLVGKGSGTLKFSTSYLAGPFMSNFSSWGVLPNLQLSPDITAHGGEIYSSVAGTDEYGTYSGTSMACPNLAGALILVREYVKNFDSTLTTSEVRDLSYSLMMSTATIVNNEEGNPYSPRKQGAGLADIKKSVSTKAYLTVDGSNKPKASLGDDPSKTGEYTIRFNIVNVSGSALSYNINPVVMTESMSSDGKTVAEKAYLFEDAEKSYSVKATQGQASLNGSKLSLQGYSEAIVTVTVRLTAEDKAYLDKNFKNGMYVEGFVELESLNADKIDLNLPYLAFYGDWTAAPILDVTAYEVGESAIDDSVLAEDKLVADVYGTLPMAGFTTTDSSGNEKIGSWGMGAFSYNLASGYTMPTTLERYASLTTSESGNYQLYIISAGLLRGAKRVDMEIRDSVTNELIWSHTDYNARKSHSSGGSQTGGTIMVEFDARELNLANNSKYVFSMECFLDWDGEQQNNRNTFSFEFTVDNENPVLTGTKVREVEGSNGNINRYIDFNVYDNHYLQGYIVYTYDSIDAEGNLVGQKPIVSGVMPITGEYNATTTVTLNVTSVWKQIRDCGGKLYVQFMDYAKNTSTYKVRLEPSDVMKLEKTRNAKDEYSIAVNGQLDLNDYIRIFTEIDGEYFEDYQTYDLVWESSDPEAVEVKDGLVTGLKANSSSMITVHAAQDPAVSLNFKINVGSQETTIKLTGLKLSDTALSLERGESATLEVSVEPYNYENDVTVEWTSTSSDVTVTVDKDNPFRATVYAKESGGATIRVSADGTYISAYCSVQVKEEFTVDGVYLRSYTGRGDENGVVEIPDDLGISYIYPYAFMNNEYIKKIIIPEGVKYIMEASVYGCSNLEEVVLPESCEEVQTWAFGWCSSLEKINLENVKVIGQLAFYNCSSLTEIDLSHTTYIKERAFTLCSGLKSVNLGKVGVVGDYAFAACSGLTELVIPAHTSTGLAAFTQCTGLTSVTIYADNVGPGAFYLCSSLTDVNFLGDVDTIGIQAFESCTALKNVNFGGGVYEIASRAFYGCTAMTEFTLPANLTVLGQMVFANDNNLKTVNVDKDAKITEADMAAFYGNGVTAFNVEEGNKYLSSENGVLYDRNMTKLVAYPYGKSATRFTVPDSVRTIGESAFAASTRVGTVELNNVERIEDYAFYSAASVQVTDFDNLKYIGDYAFAGASITVLPISENTEYIGKGAFTQCTSLTDKSLVLPDGLKYLGEFAFSKCAFTSVKLGSGLEEAGTSAFSTCEDLESVQLGSSLKMLSDEMFAACTSLESIVIPDSVERLGVGTFYGCTSLKNVKLSSALTEIADYAFAGTAIQTIEVPESVTAVGAYAFNVSKIEEFDFKNIETIGVAAFTKTRLKSVESDAVKTVGNGAFNLCSSIVSVDLPNAVKIGLSAFDGCNALAEVNLPSAAEIGDKAFAACTSLTSLSLGAAETIGDEAFMNAATLSSVSLPVAETLGRNAFSGTQIKKLELPATLTSISEQAFSGAAGLSEIEVAAENPVYLSEDGAVYYKNEGNLFTLIGYPEGKTDKNYSVKKRTVKIGAYAFAGNRYLEEVTLPEHVQIIGAAAFYEMPALKKLIINSVSAPILECYASEKEGGALYEYNNFPKAMGDSMDITIQIPSNNEGYDNYIWKNYVGLYLSATGEVQAAQNALDFMDRAAALPETITLADREEIEDLAMIYNTLSAEQKEFVQGGYDGTNYQKLLAAAQDKLAALDAGETDPEPSPEPDGNKDKGCKSHAEAGGLAVAVIAVLAGAALFVSKRKTEEK